MARYHREVKTPLDSLINDGKFAWGTYNKGFDIVNPLDAKNIQGISNIKFFKNLNLKEWEAFQFGDKRFFGLGAIYNTKLLGLFEFILYDKKNDKVYHKRKFCMQKNIHVANGLNNSCSSFENKKIKAYIYNSIKNNAINVSLNTEHLILDLKGKYNTNPIVISQPFARNRGLYSHKALMKCDGNIRIGNLNYNFDEESSFLVIDDHKGFYPKVVKYDWITGVSSKRGLQGFNLTNNQVKNHELYNENCFWNDGEMNVLPPVEFVRKKEGEKEVWYIKDKYDQVNIRFYPLVKNKLKFNYLLVWSNYEGPLGRFEGYIDIGKKYKLNSFYGMGEKKRYRM